MWEQRDVKVNLLATSLCSSAAGWGLLGVELATVGVGDHWGLLGEGRACSHLLVFFIPSLN